MNQMTPTYLSRHTCLCKTGLNKMSYTMMIGHYKTKCFTSHQTKVKCTLVTVAFEDLSLSLSYVIIIFHHLGQRMTSHGFPSRYEEPSTSNNYLC